MNGTIRLKLLFIEDNEDILTNLFAWFEKKGHVCDCARSGDAGLKLALEGNFDCILLDIMLTGLDGVQVCEKIRESDKTVPIIMLTAKDGLEDKVTGLDSGADDYLVKPFSLKELEARISAVSRRSQSRKAILTFGELQLNRKEHRVRRANMELQLSPTGFMILEALMKQAPGVVAKERLEELIWGDEAPEGSELRNHIHELRKVVDKPFDNSILETVPHIGWRLKTLPNSEQ